jgi:hypothetical protein
MPLWLGAGLADWYRHRQTHIETTAGPRESATHLLTMTETGIPVMLGLFPGTNGASRSGRSAVTRCPPRPRRAAHRDPPDADSLTPRR